jgi:DNA polymerase elongation subunit (family B)
MTTNEYYTNVQVIGNSIYYRGMLDGQEVRQRLPWHPTLFLPSPTPTEWKTVSGDYVKPSVLGDIRETRNFIREHEGVRGFTVHGNQRFEYNFIQEKFPQEVIEWDIEQLTIFNMDIEVISDEGFPDPTRAEWEIVSIAIKYRGKYILFGTQPFDSKAAIITQADGKQVPLEVVYVQCADEAELLTKFIEFWRKNNPHIVTGWNVKTFDMPYIINRIRKILGDNQANKLSIWGMIKDIDSFFMARTYKCYEVVGTAILDYLELFWKYATKQSESFKLDYICQEQIGERKLSYEEYSSLPRLYRENPQQFYMYNLRDVWLVDKLDEKMKLLFLSLTLAYDSHTNYEDVFAQVTMWDQIINCHLMRKKMVIPPRQEREKIDYEGAYVKQPHPGQYKWIASFDLNSLYPHLIMQYNISPDTIVEPQDYTLEMREVVGSRVTVDKLLSQKIDLSFLGPQKVTMTPNGQYFRVDRHGFLPEIMDTMYKDRVRYKNKAIDAKKELEKTTDPDKRAELVKTVARFDTMQNVKKVCLNSAYGALGNNYFRFFDVRQAEGITTAGQFSIRWVANHLNEYLNRALKTEGVDYVIASDTDSVYLELEAVVKAVYPAGDKDSKTIIKMLDRFCDERIQPEIEKSYQGLARYVNAYEQKMQMKRESLCDKGIWTAPKRYILNVYNKEGVEYEKPKLEIKGLEVIKSNTPSSCRKSMKEAIKIIMNGSEADLHKFTETFRKEFATLPVDEIAFPTGVKGLSKFSDKNTIYGKGTPFHVKACLLYNHKLRTMQLHTKYPLINEGDKVKFLHLKNNNPMGDRVIGFIEVLPKEFELESYIDRSNQFKSAYIEKLAIITNCIGWSVEKQAKLDI